MKNTACLALAITAAIAASLDEPAAVLADAISPAIKNTGKTYSKEKPDTGIYGTGIGGRYMEASMLRFEIDRHLQDGEYDKAIVKAKKACQLDPADPDTHLLLARALTQKLQQSKGKIDEKVLAEAMSEWRMLWLHNADSSEQLEAKLNFMRLKMVAHGIAKQHALEEKARLKSKQAIAEQKDKQDQEATDPRQPDGKDKPAATQKSGADKSADASTNESESESSKDKTAAKDEPVEIAHKRKRFVVF